MYLIRITLGPVFLSIVSLTADLGVASLILTLSYTSLEIVSMVIFLLLLIQDGLLNLLSVSSESICTKYWLSI